VKADDLLTAFLSLEKDALAPKGANGNATRPNVASEYAYESRFAAKPLLRSAYMAKTKLSRCYLPARKIATARKPSWDRTLRVDRTKHRRQRRPQ
jgi:hypothetical protein